MKKIVLSSLVALTLGSVSVSADSVKFYQDEVGQVFTTPAEGRTAIKSPTPVFSKASKLKFSGKSYLGYTYKSMDVDNSDSTDAQGQFELRRNYIQLKAYLLEDPKSYFRFTLDGEYKEDGYAGVFVKYAYLYLNDVLPFTGMEIGLAHTPWIDYETHYGWGMRSISKSFMDDQGLLNSADYGVNFKTKTPYFTSEVGIFNGEGYHGSDENDDVTVGDGNSFDWRLTAAIMGNGDKKRKVTKDTFLDVSFYGEINNNSAKNNGENYTVYGTQAVYNMPSFLVSGMYVVADSDTGGITKYNVDGYTLNAIYRLGDKKEYSVFARYDNLENKNVDTDVTESTERKYIYGVAWAQNKNVKWLLSGENYNIKESDDKDYKKVMLTAEVKW